jgi:hypothetical protein
MSVPLPVGGAADALVIAKLRAFVFGRFTETIKYQT